MVILAIETSCDETAIAILKTPRLRSGQFRILSNIVASQVKIHAKWGGVVPNLAKREHIKNLPIVLKKALKEAEISAQGPASLKRVEAGGPASGWKKIDLVAVTIGPGLEPALWTGINFAKDLAEKWNKPIIAVNHMEGHIVTSLLNSKIKSQKLKLIKFPALALLVSGGHTELVLMRKLLDYKIIGSTRDDAAGEAFDKVAKMLGFPYPGGPEVARMASRSDLGGKRSDLKLPRPMINSKNYDFSFSGLKTAVLYLWRDLEKKVPILSDRRKLIPFICAEFQQAVIDVLISKTLRAAKEYKVKTIILGGGVAANKELRKQLSNQLSVVSSQIKLLMPDIKFTGDNAAMIALSAYFHALKKQFTKPEYLKAEGNLKLS